MKPTTASTVHSVHTARFVHGWNALPGYAGVYVGTCCGVFGGLVMLRGHAEPCHGAGWLSASACSFSTIRVSPRFRALPCVLVVKTVSAKVFFTCFQPALGFHPHRHLPLFAVLFGHRDVVPTHFAPCCTVCRHLSVHPSKLNVESRLLWLTSAATMLPIRHIRRPHQDGLQIRGRWPSGATMTATAGLQQ